MDVFDFPSSGSESGDVDDKGAASFRDFVAKTPSSAVKKPKSGASKNLASISSSGDSGIEDDKIQGESKKGPYIRCTLYFQASILVFAFPVVHQRQVLLF